MKTLRKIGQTQKILYPAQKHIMLKKSVQGKSK